ncbi:hypothetical protein FQN54_007290 [Arachnomyces sp. PD_36]|nr:hypothetical protein FQN54_007290 [Arachnomyces sp. PD_36]
MSTETNKERWLALLEEEYFCLKKDTVEFDVATMLKDMLLSVDLNNAVHTTAQQLNTYYWERNNAKGPFFSWGNMEETFPDFVSFLYDIIVRLTPLISYNDPRQDVILQLVLELRRLPPNPVKAWNGDRLLTPDNDTFALQLHNTWSALWDDDSSAYSGPQDWKQHCDEWLNFSSFLARCIQVRIDDHVLVISKYPRMNIEDGLGTYIDDSIRRSCWVMVAAQYVLLAGPVLREEFIQSPSSPDWGIDKWKFWAKRFGEVGSGRGLAPEVKEAALEARRKMILLKPELFTVSEGGTKTED